MPAVVGARFGHYELLSRIGEGGMGVVFRARDLDLQREVAIKFLPEQFAADADRLARFAQEARAASALNHPNIVTIHEIGQAFGQPYIVMELVDGLTLHDMLARGRLDAKRTVDLAAQMAEGLAKAHAAGIIHRDLKPENVMVSRDGFVKILDFGLAKLRADRDDQPRRALRADDDDTHPAPATQLGAILGTVGYMSPEQAAGRQAVPQSDQFSLGAIMYEMATGQRAFARATSVQTLSAILESEPPPLQQASPDLPPVVRWIVERCLAKRSDSRFASTEDLARDLRTAREHFGEMTTGINTSTIRNWLPGPRVRRRGLIGVTVLLAAFGLLFVRPINDLVRTALGLYRLPAEKRVAVMPITCRGGTADERERCDGILDYLVIELAELDRFQQQGGIAVVPASDARAAGPVPADAIRKRLGATLAVEVTAERTAGRIDYSVSVIDTELHRVVRGDRGSLTAGEGDLFERVLAIVVELLEVALTEEAQAALRTGGTSSAEASSLFAQGLRGLPYQQAQTRLERHDQQASLEQAIELFSRAVELDPSYAHAYAGLGEAYLRLFRITRNPEHFRLAEAHCQRAISLDRLVGQAWLTLGNVRTESGRAEEALKDLAQAKLMRPRSPEVFHGTAQAYTRLQRFAEAEAEYARAIELRPDYWLTYYYYGAFLYRRARYEDAERTFRQALATGVPDNARLHSSIGGTLLARGRIEEAQRQFERSFEIQQTGSAASNMGTLLYRQGDFPAAASWFEKAAALNPRDYRWWRHAGAAYYFAPGQRDRAPAAYRRALGLVEQELALDPTDGRVIIDVADCLSMLGDRARALTLTADALARGPKDPEVQYTAADIYETLGERDLALRHLELALRAGYQRTLLETSPSFANLRTDPRYKKLMASLLEKPAGNK